MFFVRSGFPIVPDFGIEFDLKKSNFNFDSFFFKNPDLLVQYHNWH